MQNNQDTPLTLDDQLSAPSIMEQDFDGVQMSYDFYNVDIELLERLEKVLKEEIATAKKKDSSDIIRKEIDCHYLQADLAHKKATFAKYKGRIAEYHYWKQQMEEATKNPENWIVLILKLQHILNLPVNRKNKDLANRFSIMIEKQAELMSQLYAGVLSEKRRLYNLYNMMESEIKKYSSL